MTANHRTRNRPTARLPEPAKPVIRAKSNRPPAAVSQPAATVVDVESAAQPDLSRAPEPTAVAVASQGRRLMVAVRLVSWEELSATARARLMSLHPDERPSRAAINSGESIFAPDGSTWLTSWQPPSQADLVLAGIAHQRELANRKFDTATEIVRQLGQFESTDQSEIRRLISDIS